jgi:hypothetical protein
MNYQDIINKIYKKKLLMGNPFAYYKIDTDKYFVSKDKIFTYIELVEFFKNNIYTIEESEIKNL